MELLNFEKETPETSGLRLVADNKEPQKFPIVEKQFVNFMFFRVNPEWRRLDAESKLAYKKEFQSVFNHFREDFLLYPYSMVGFDSKADFMIWRIGTSLDLIQEMTARLYRTELGRYLETADNYLSATKKMMFISPIENPDFEDRFHVHAGQKKYHFVYPCAKHSDWYAKTGEERDSLVEEHFMVGKKFPNIRIHLTHAFGFSDQDYIVSFETDEPKDFLALAEELKETSLSKFTMRGMPIYTCRQRDLMECLDALG
ncbi:MAG: chlorite dismutase [Acidobacteria bacterium]|jgi:chlorite dismutase|nr:chlorite dismutase [Acidobacteriota bacterium]